MAAKRTTLFYVAIVCCVVFAPLRASAQWWSRAPSDYEECAAAAERTAKSKEALASLIAGCESKFAGRRKPEGGYTYFDFMQNRHFDIAGPNPTREEQKKIDEQYTDYLSDQRRSVIAAAFFEKQRQQARQTVGSSGNIKIIEPSKPAGKSAVAVVPRPRPKAASCNAEFFSSCNWPKLTSSVRDLKKTLFGSSSKKDVRG